MANCAKCSFIDKRCRQENGSGPADCPTMLHDKTVEKALEKYKDGLYKDFALGAAMQEGAGYARCGEGMSVPVKTRLEETIEFCQRMGYQKIGLAFCLGLQKEAAVVSDILKANGLDVTSVICKVGGICKEDFGIEDRYKINPGEYEVICNPIAQAEICNEEDTEFNIVMGLCVGHDSMFLKNANALCTVFAVKDRVLAHNPLGAVYTSHTFYKKLKKRKK